MKKSVKKKNLLFLNTVKNLKPLLKSQIYKIDKTKIRKLKGYQHREHYKSIQK